MVDSEVILASENGLGGDLAATTNPQGDSLTLSANNGDWDLFHIGGTLTVPANQPQGDCHV